MILFGAAVCHFLVVVIPEEPQRAAVDQLAFVWVDFPRAGMVLFVVVLPVQPWPRRAAQCFEVSLFGRGDQEARRNPGP